VRRQANTIIHGILDAADTKVFGKGKLMEKSGNLRPVKRNPPIGLALLV
jgi:hypothetical protein